MNRTFEYHEQELLNSNRKKLAEAYVPWQCFGRLYSPSEALDRGTLFPELYRPYHKKGR